MVFEKILPFLFFFPCFARSSQDLTLEEKVGQLLLPHFIGSTINEDAKTLIHEAHVSGFVYYTWANELKSPEAVQALSRDLQKESPIPLFLAVDQEGGVVARLKRGFTIFPSNRALAKINDPHCVEESAWASGQELKAVGINMNYAPVIDVDINPNNPVIGLRSFGGSVEQTTELGKRALRGYQRAGVIGVLKHFPGHGDVAIDSHFDLPIVHKTLQELESIELYPFSHLAKEADVIMTAHLLVPALDPENCATLSKKILQNLLRDKLGFKGIITSDSLVMKGVLGQCGSLEEAALRSFLAGCDLLVLSGQEDIGTVRDILNVHRYLVDAVKKGKISEERLNASVGRILSLKRKYGLFNTPSFSGDFSFFSAHRKLAKNLACSSVTVEDMTVAIDFEKQKILLVAPEIVKTEILDARLPPSVEIVFFNEKAVSEEKRKACSKLAEQKDVLILCAYNAWQYPEEMQFLSQLKTQGKKVLFMILRDLRDQKLLPKANGFLITYGPSPVSIEAVIEKLELAR